MSGSRLQHPNAPCIILSFFENNDDNLSKKKIDYQYLRDPDTHLIAQEPFKSIGNKKDNPSKRQTDQQSYRDPDEHLITQESLDFFNTQISDNFYFFCFDSYDEQEIAIIDPDIMTIEKSELVDDNNITNAEDQVDIATLNDTNSIDDASEIPIGNFNKQKTCSHAGKRPHKRDHAFQKHISVL